MLISQENCHQSAVPGGVLLNSVHNMPLPLVEPQYWWSHNMQLPHVYCTVLYSTVRVSTRQNVLQKRTFSACTSMTVQLVRTSADLISLSYMYVLDNKP
jgi:hypothetical protein